MAEPVKPPEEVVATLLSAEYARLSESSDDIDLSEQSSELERKLWRSHHDEYLAWLRSRGRREIRQALQTFIRTRRAQASRTVLRRFDEIASQLEAGELSAERLVDTWRLNIGEGIERRLMDATGRDLDCGIERQGKIADAAGLEQAFYRYLRKRTSDDATISSVMSAEEVVRIRREVFGKKVVPLSKAA